MIFYKHFVLATCYLLLATSMSLRSRRIIYLTFILIFLLITPTIILYTAGYRYNFQKHRIQKTGILILKSRPEGAKIFLNNKLNQLTTPARIANLLPDDYLIKIEKDGFYSWQKTLPVQSRLTTFAENILLFKKTMPAQIVDGNIEFLSLAPNKQKLIYLQKQDTGQEIWLLDDKTSKKSLLYRSSDNQTLKPEWNRDGRQILITVRDNVLKTPKYIVLDSERGGAVVYSNLSDFYFEFKDVKSNFINAPSLDDASLIDSPPQFITVLNQKNQSLAVIRSDSGETIFEANGNAAAWSKDGGKLLYLKNFEIWIYDLFSEQETLITRYSKEIKKALWINGNYVLVLLDNALKVIELDERNQRNVTDLLTLEKIDDYDIDNVRQKIYLIGEIGNKKGIYELPY